MRWGAYQVLLFQKRGRNNGKLIGVFWGDSETRSGVKQDQDRTFPVTSVLRSTERR